MGTPTTSKKSRLIKKVTWFLMQRLVPRPEIKRLYDLDHNSKGG